MSREGVDTRLARLLAMVPWMASRPQGTTLEELAERFDRTVTRLRGRGRVTRQHRPRGSFGIDGVRLAFAATSLAVRSIDLDHVHAPGPEMP